MFTTRIDPRSWDIQILSELSAWNKHVCSPLTRRQWMNMSGGPLSAAEQKALRHFAYAMRNGPDTAWGMLLIASLEKRRLLLHSAGWASIFRALEQAETVFGRRRTILQKKLGGRSRSTRQYLHNHTRNLHFAWNSLEHFLHLTRVPIQPYITILLPQSTSFEAWSVDKKNILVVPPQHGNTSAILRVLLHEYGHLLFRNHRSLRQTLHRQYTKLQKKEQQYLSRLGLNVGLSGAGVFEELLLSSLAPEGRLASLLLPQTRWSRGVGNDPLRSIREAVATKTESAVQEHHHGSSSMGKYWSSVVRALNNHAGPP